MKNSMTIDTLFDFRSDTPASKDPDTWSPTLSCYHKHLWSKPLPCGTVFHLEYRNAPYYLKHSSTLGEFSLSSDTVVPTYWWLKNIRELVTEQELADFRSMAFTIGGMMVFPSNQIERQWTINQTRGLNRQLSDRFDLTVECIRRHYIAAESPIGEALNRYSDFFRLFKDFQGYVEFFHLQDLVRNDGSSVNFFLPFDNFNSSPVPHNASAYRDYRERAVEFITSRNQRICDWG